MSLLDMILGKKKEPVSSDVTVHAVSLDAAHSTAQRRGNYPAQNTANAWSPTLPHEFPALPNQDAILTHDMLPGGTDDTAPPQAFYADRNESTIERDAANSRYIAGTPNQIVIRQGIADQSGSPYLAHPTGYTRPTQRNQGLGYSFIRPFYPGTGVGQSTGEHFSMASNRRNYPIMGMAPQRSFRNTFRLEPVARDAENTDLNSTTTPAASPAIYVSPASGPSSKWGLG